MQSTPVARWSARLTRKNDVFVHRSVSLRCTSARHGLTTARALGMAAGVFLLLQLLLFVQPALCQSGDNSSSATVPDIAVARVFPVEEPRPAVVVEARANSTFGAGTGGGRGGGGGGRGGGGGHAACVQAASTSRCYPNADDINPQSEEALLANDRMLLQIVDGDSGGKRSSTCLAPQATRPSHKAPRLSAGGGSGGGGGGDGSDGTDQLASAPRPEASSRKLKNAFQMMSAAAKKTPDELDREKRDAKAKAKAKAAEREAKERLEALQALQRKQEREREESEAALTRQRWSSQPWRSPDMVTITLKFHLTRSHNLCDATGLTFKRREKTSDLTGDLTPALVDSVASGDSGCESGDWITHINGESTESPLMNLPDLEAYLHRIFFTSNRHGTGATLTVRRQGRSRCATMATTPSNPARPPTAPTGPTGPAHWPH